MRRSPFRILVAAGVSLTVALPACGGGGKKGSSSPNESTTPAAGNDKLTGQVAGYDIAAAGPARFIYGIFNEAKGPVGYGTIPLSFFFLGETSASGTPQPGPTATGTYLPLPASPPPPPDTSKPLYLPSSQRGVYAAQVTFDRAGFWGVSAAVDLPDGSGQGAKKVNAAFQVLAKHSVPAAGDAAIGSKNLTVSTPGAPPEAVDSRASATTPVPDADLHQTTVAQALAEKRPVVLVISTPTYCVSLFCGPVTDMIDGLGKVYGDRARFIHVEVWKDFKAQQLNEAAQEWIARGNDVNEPWVFLIGADGKISARFDNVVTREELEPLLKALPPMKKG